MEPEVASDGDRKLTCEELVDGIDLNGRVVLITGANGGLGFESARALARAGARVWMAARTLATAEQAVHQLLALQPDADLHPMELDLCSLASVREAAAGFAERRLDDLICNAGVYPATPSVTQDGFEETMAVCHVGHFLLFELLLDRLKAAGNARVVVVASDAHRFPRRLDLENLVSPRRSHVAYAQAKLCNILFARELDRRYRSLGIRGISVHPGALLPTGIMRHSKVASAVTWLARPFTRSVPEGAAAVVFCSLSSELEEIAGQYVMDLHPAVPSAEAQNDQVAEALWERTEELLAG